MFTCFVSCMIKRAKKRLGIRFNMTFHYDSLDRHPPSAIFMSSVVFVRYVESLHMIIFDCWLLTSELLFSFLMRLSSMPSGSDVITHLWLRLFAGTGRGTFHIYPASKLTVM